MSVILRRMTDAEFQAFCAYSIQDHARELMQQNQLAHETAVAEAQKELAEMLPDGIHTERHFLMTIEDAQSNMPVGFLWTIHEETDGKKQSFLCDFVIHAEHRRKGYATDALQVMEQTAREVGCQESVLFVANGNTAANALYEKCGYQFLRHMDDGKYLIKQL